MKEYYLTDKDPIKQVTDAGLRKWLQDRNMIMGVKVNINPYMMDNDNIWDVARKNFFNGLIEQMLHHEKVKLRTHDNTVDKGVSGRVIVMSEHDLIDLLSLLDIEVVKTMNGDIV